MEKIKAFKRKYFDEWALGIPKVIEEKTKNTILARQGQDLILNFSPMVRRNTSGSYLRILLSWAK